MQNKEYIDIYEKYKSSLATVDAVLDKQLEATLALESGKIKEVDYKIKIKALEILESQLKETEEQKKRWLNAGQVI